MDDFKLVKAKAPYQRIMIGAADIYCTFEVSLDSEIKNKLMPQDLRYVYKIYEILPDKSFKLLGVFRYQRHAKSFLNYLEQGHR